MSSIKAHDKVQVLVKDAQFRSGMSYDPARGDATGTITAVLPDSRFYTVVLDAPNWGEMLVAWEDARPLVAVKRPLAKSNGKRCKHQNGELLELVTVSHFWFVSDGDLGTMRNDQEGEPDGRWLYTCHDCKKTWRMTELGKTRLRWLQRICDQVEAGSNE